MTERATGERGLSEDLHQRKPLTYPTIGAGPSGFRVRKALALLPVLLLTACNQEEAASDHRVIDGDPQMGRAAIADVECGVCHSIPGIAGADGIVGPPLEDFAQRQFIAGVLPNQPGILARWVREAPSLLPETGMPDMPLSEEEARDVAAYLYTLR
jgi:mono/diheme cytochrome c family protein